jgi:hypothetical protein
MPADAPGAGGAMSLRPERSNGSAKERRIMLIYVLEYHHRRNSRLTGGSCIWIGGPFGSH